MQPAGEDIDRAAIRIVRGIRDKLIVEPEVDAIDDFDIVVGLKNILKRVMRQLSVSDRYAESARGEIGPVRGADSVYITPAIPKVSASRFHSAPFNCVPSATLSSQSVNCHSSIWPSRQLARRNAPTFLTLRWRRVMRVNLNNWTGDGCRRWGRVPGCGARFRPIESGKNSYVEPGLSPDADAALAEINAA